MLHRVHPLAGSRQALNEPREDAQEEVGRSQPQSEREEDAEAQAWIAELAHDRQECHDDRTDTGCRDEADEKPHSQRAREARATGDAASQPCRHPELPHSKHGEPQRDHHRGEAQ